MSEQVGWKRHPWNWGLLFLVCSALAAGGEHLLDHCFPPVSSAPMQEGLGFFFPLRGDFTREGPLEGTLELEFPAVWRSGGLWLDPRTYSVAKFEADWSQILSRPYSLGLQVELPPEYSEEDARPWEVATTHQVLVVSNKQRQRQLSLVLNLAQNQLLLYEGNGLLLRSSGLNRLGGDRAFHVLLSRGTERLEVYWNGRLIESIQMPLPPALQGMKTLGLGQSQVHPGGEMVVKDFGFWSRALSAQEAAEVYVHSRERGRHQNPWFNPQPPLEQQPQGGPWYQPVGWRWLFWVPVYAAWLWALIGWAYFGGRSLRRLWDADSPFSENTERKTKE